MMLSRMLSVMKEPARRLSFFLRNSRYDPAKVRNTNLTILCNNCVGGLIYNGLGARFNSPTINLYFTYPDYVKFLEKLPDYLSAELEFKDDPDMAEPEFNFPVGALGDIKVYFAHDYADRDVAKRKWEERSRRIIWENIFVIGSDRDGCTVADIERFDCLPYRNKVFFSALDLPQYRSVVTIDRFKKQPCVGNMGKSREYLNYFDLARWLNTGEIIRFGLRKHLYRWLYE